MTPAPSAYPSSRGFRCLDRAATGVVARWGPAGAHGVAGPGVIRHSGHSERNEPVEVPAERPVSAERADAKLAVLVERMAQGDDAALAALYDATSATVHGLALRIVRDPGAAEEVTIDVYSQAFRQAGSYDAQRGNPWAWLLTMARSRAIDRLRAERSRVQRQQPLETVGDLPGLDPDPEAASHLAERGRLVRAALAGLPPDQRQAIEIAYFTGLSHSEIAARLGQPVGTVKTRIRAAMMRLRESLTPLFVEERA